MFLSKFKTVKALLLLAASLSVSGCGTKIGIQIEKVLNSPDVFIINNGEKYTQSQELKLNLESLHMFYSINESEDICESSIPTNLISNKATVEKTGMANEYSTYYAKFYSLDGDRSGCLKATILVDNLPSEISTISFDVSTIIPGDYRKSPEIKWSKVNDQLEDVGNASGVDFYEISIYPKGAMTTDIPFVSKKVYETLINPLPTFTEMTYTFDLTDSGLSFSLGQSYKAVLRIHDKAGNVTALRESDYWSFDSTPPVVTSISMTSDSLGSCSKNGIFFAKKSTTGSPSFLLEATDDTSGLSHALVSAVNELGVVVLSDFRVNFLTGGLVDQISNLTLSGVFATGHTYSLSVKVVDKAGNISLPSISPAAWLVDTDIPTFIGSISGVPLYSNFDGLPSAISIPFPIVNTATEKILNDSLTKIYVQDVDAPSIKFPIDFTSPPPSIASSSLVSGHKYKIVADAVDCVGNANSISSASWIQDSTAPILDSLSTTAKINNLVFNGSKQLSFSFTKGSDVAPFVGAFVSGVDKYKYRFIKSGVSSPSESSNTATTYGFASDEGSITGVPASSLISGTYIVEMIVIDKAGNESSIYTSSTNVAVINTPPSCTGPSKLPLAANLPSANLYTLNGGLLYASKSITNTVKVDFSGLTCVDALANSINKFKISFRNEAGAELASDLLISPATKLSAFVTTLTSGYKYKFVVKGVDQYSGESNSFESELFLVDASAPSITSGVTLSSKLYMNSSELGGESSPLVSWTVPSDQPAVNVGLNVGAAQIIEIYKAQDSNGTLGSTPLKIVDDSTLAATTSSKKFSGLSVGTFQDGYFYTAVLKSKDQIDNLSPNSAGVASSTWLVDLTAPVINSSPFAVQPKQNISDKIEMTVAASGFASDNKPLGSMAASGLNIYKAMVVRVDASSTSTPKALYAIPTVSDISANAILITPGSLATFDSPMGGGLYRVLVYAFDKAGNISTAFGSNDFAFSTSAPTCNGSLSLVDMGYTDPLSTLKTYPISSTSLAANFNGRSPEINWSTLNCTSSNGLPLTYKLQIMSGTNLIGSLSQDVTAIGAKILNFNYAPMFSESTDYYARMVISDGVKSLNKDTVNSWFVDTKSPNIVSNVVLNSASGISYINSNDVTNLGFGKKTKSLAWSPVTDNPSGVYGVGNIKYKILAFEVSITPSISKLNSTPVGISSLTASASGVLDKSADLNAIFVNGKYYGLTVRAVDGLSNENLTDSIFDVKNVFLVDTVAPNQGAISGTPIVNASNVLSFNYATALSDTGTNPSGFDFANVSIYNGVTLKGSFTNLTSTTAFSQSIASLGLGNGIYTIAIDVYDKAGNKSSNANAGSFAVSAGPDSLNIDLVKATTPVNESTYDLTAFSKTAFISKLVGKIPDKVSFSFSSYANLGSFSVKVFALNSSGVILSTNLMSVNSFNSSKCVISGAPAINYLCTISDADVSLSSNLTTGTYYVAQVVVNDVNGKSVSGYSNQYWLVDNVLPTIAAGQTPSSTFSSWFGSSGTVQLAFSMTDGGVNPSGVAFSEVGLYKASTKTDTTGTLIGSIITTSVGSPLPSYAASGLSEGYYVAQLYAFDKALNKSLVSYSRFGVDTTAPTIAGGVSMGLDTVNVSSVYAAVTITSLSCSDPGSFASGFKKYSVEVLNSSDVNIVSPTFEFTTLSSFPQTLDASNSFNAILSNNQTYTPQITCYDSAGNTSVVQGAPFTVNISPPSVDAVTFIDHGHSTQESLFTTNLRFSPFSSSYGIKNYYVYVENNPGDTGNVANPVKINFTSPQQYNGTVGNYDPSTNTFTSSTTGNFVRLTPAQLGCANEVGTCVGRFNVADLNGGLFKTGNKTYYRTCVYAVDYANNVSVNAFGSVAPKCGFDVGNANKPYWSYDKSCPPNYLLVEDSGKPSFCVAKYEMKPLSNTDNTPTSQANMPPLVLAYAADYFSHWGGHFSAYVNACASVSIGGKQLRLMNLSERQRIAKKIELNPINWKEKVLPSNPASTNANQINTGNMSDQKTLTDGFSGNSVPSGIPASTDDVEGCYFISSASDAKCGASGWDMSKRTHIVDGQVIWDFSGNVVEAITNDLFTGAPAACSNFSASSTPGSCLAYGSSTSYSASRPTNPSIGNISANSGYDINGYKDFLGGGGFDNSGSTKPAGIYSLYSAMYFNIVSNQGHPGFRCVLDSN